MLDTCRPPILPSVPIFSTTAPRSWSALDVLAAAAAATDQPNPCQGMEEINLMLPPAEALNQPGPFNPVAALPNKLVKRILNLDFVDHGCFNECAFRHLDTPPNYFLVLKHLGNRPWQPSKQRFALS